MRIGSSSGAIKTGLGKHVSRESEELRFRIAPSVQREPRHRSVAKWPEARVLKRSTDCALHNFLC